MGKAHEFLIENGIKSNKDTITAFVMEQWLERFAEQQVKLFAISNVSDLFISFARFVENYGKKKYETSYEDMFKQWVKQRNI